MSTKTVRSLLVAAVVLQLLWCILQPAENRLAPKSPEMAQALREYQTNRTAITEAALWGQVRRDELRDARRAKALFISMLLADIVAIYLFWNHGFRKPAT